MNILVTGSSGFLGGHIFKKLKEDKENKVFGNGENKRLYDLRSEEQTRALFNDTRPEYVIHCAGLQGGIGFNRENPVALFCDNTQMALNITKLCQERKVKKLLSILPSCSYPDEDVLFEENYWDSLPNPSVEAHGLGKRNLMALSRAYHRQYKSPFVCVALTNLFGPGDTFDTDDAKVVGRVISKIAHAKRHEEKEVVFWGTGAPMREFMYVKDAAESIINALYSYEDSMKPLNIGVDSEFTIKELVELVADILEYKGEIKWDTTKPDGQMRKFLVKNNSWPETPIDEALEETIKEYLKGKRWA